MIMGISKLAIEKFKWNEVVIHEIDPEGRENRYSYDSKTWMLKRIEKLWDEGYSLYKLMVYNEYFDLQIYFKKLSQRPNVTYGQEAEFMTDGTVTVTFNHGTWREYGIRRPSVYNTP